MGLGAGLYMGGAMAGQINQGMAGQAIQGQPEQRRRK